MTPDQARELIEAAKAVLASRRTDSVKWVTVPAGCLDGLAAALARVEQGVGVEWRDDPERVNTPHWPIDEFTIVRGRRCAVWQVHPEARIWWAVLDGEGVNSHELASISAPSREEARRQAVEFALEQAKLAAEKAAGVR